MAIALSTKPNTEAPSSAYPFASIRDASGLTLGTPVSRLVYSDFHQFFEKMMDFAGVTHNGLPDNDTNGYQLHEALLATIQLQSQKYLFSDLSEALSNVTAISGVNSRYNLPTSKSFYEFDFVNNVTDVAITTFGTAPTNPSMSYFVFNQNPTGSNFFRIILNSTTLGGGLPIVKQGISTANTVYDLEVNKSFIVISWSDRWEIIDSNFSTEWTSISGAGTDFSAQPAFCTIDSSKFVRMKGQSIFEDETGTTSKTIGTLPAGFRPIETVFFNTVATIGGVFTPIAGTILTNGTINILNTTTGTLQINLSDLPSFRNY